MKRLLTLAAVISLALPVSAQSWFPVASESTSTTLTLPAGTTYELGVTNCPSTGAPSWSASVTITTATTFSPLVWTVSSFPFADPCPNTVKSLLVKETLAAQSLALNGVVLHIPSTRCASPSAEIPNPVLSSYPLDCTLLPNSLAVAPDGASVTVLGIAAPVILQYCQGAVCNAPFMFGPGNPLIVGQNVMLGGSPGGIGVGTLYVIESFRPVELSWIAIAGGTPTLVTVPVAGS